MLDIIKYYIRVFLFLGSFFGIGISFFNTNFSAMLICIVLFIFSTILLIISTIKRKQQKNNDNAHIQSAKRNNQVPIVSLFCKHCNGLPLADDSQCRLTIFRNMIYIYSGSLEFRIPMERVISISPSTTVHTDYELKSHPMRGLIGALFFGEAGLLFGADHKLVKKETAENVLAITYSKGETIQSITLGDINCKKVLTETNRYIDFKRKNVEL